MQHAGWVGSICLACVVSYAQVTKSLLPLLPFWWVAAGAVASDLAGIDVGNKSDAFACGNFGILILRATTKSAAFQTLRAMLRITMVRGAQSAVRSWRSNLRQCLFGANLPSMPLPTSSRVRKSPLRRALSPTNDPSESDAA